MPRRCGSFCQKMVGLVAKREAVAHLQVELGLSERRACNIVSADRKMIRYRSCRAPDPELRIQLRELANARRRFGYPSNASGGDSGYYTNLELHKNWNSQVVGLDTYLFTDFGQIYSTFPVNREAWSAGFGLSWTPASWVTTELSMGFPLKTLVANQSEFAIYYRISFRPL